MLRHFNFLIDITKKENLIYRTEYSTTNNNMLTIYLEKSQHNSDLLYTKKNYILKLDLSKYCSFFCVTQKLCPSKQFSPKSLKFLKGNLSYCCPRLSKF